MFENIAKRLNRKHLSNTRALHANMTKALKGVTTGLKVWEALISCMGFDTENGCMKYRKCQVLYPKNERRLSRRTRCYTLCLEKDYVLREAYYKYVREDGHYPESYRCWRFCMKDTLKANTYLFNVMSSPPKNQEREEIDRQLPSYSRAFIPKTKCIAMLNNIRNPMSSCICLF